MNSAKRDTRKALIARSAAAARRRHAKWIKELAEYGIDVPIPESYTGQKITQDI